MRGASGLAMLWFSLLLFSHIASAQCNVASPCVEGIPHLVRFSGIVKNEGGQPQTVGITFAIYSDSSGGAALWQETQNVRVDQQGRYAVLLGVTKVEGVPPELFSSGERRWLGVQAQLPGEVEGPRTLLTSVPYALQAGDAQTLGGLPPSAFLKVPTADSSTVQGGQIASNSTAQMVVGVAAGVPGQSTGQPVGTPNAIPRFSSSSSMVSSQIRDSNGMVTMRNLANIVFADQFSGGVPDAIAACPAEGCVIYAVSPKVSLNLGTIDPGSKAVTLYLGPFTYTVTQIMVRRNLQIIGMGSGITFLQSVNSNNPVIVCPQAVNGAATNVFLSGFRLIGSAGNTSEDAIMWDGSGFFNSGVWYSEARDIFITGFAGNGIHLVGMNANFSGMSQWVEFNRVVVFRPKGAGNGLRIEGAAYELYFNDCQFDGTAPGDGTNIFIGARPGNPYGIPIDVNFRGLTSQNAATAVQIDGGWAVSFYSPHHEFVWGVYLLTGDLGASIAGVTISDAGFQTSGVNGGAGYLLNVTNPSAAGIRFIHNNIMGPADAVVRAPTSANVVYRDNMFFGGTDLPVTAGITTQVTSAAAINIGGAHTVGVISSTIPITTIRSGLGPGEMATFFSIGGPVIFGSGGNINLMGMPSLTVNGSITFVVSDLGTVPSWVPVSQWSASAASVGFGLSSSTPSASIARGGSATYDLTLTPQGGFGGSVDFSCNGVPRTMSCLVSPDPMLVNGSNPISATVSVTPRTPPPRSSTQSQKAAHQGSSLLALLSLGLVGIVVVPLRWAGKKRQRKTVQILSLLVLAEYSLGCGAVAHSQEPLQSPIPPTEYTVQVTASAGAITRSITFALTVN
jgi:hypothetical protein